MSKCLFPRSKKVKQYELKDDTVEITTDGAGKHLLACPIEGCSHITKTRTPNKFKFLIGEHLKYKHELNQTSIEPIIANLSLLSQKNSSNEKRLA